MVNNNNNNGNGDNDNKDEILSEIYTDISNPASYGSVDKLYRASKIINNKISRNDVKNFLANNRTYHFIDNQKRNLFEDKHSVNIQSI